MKKQVLYHCLLILFTSFFFSHAQDTVTKSTGRAIGTLFTDQQILPIKLAYSIKEVKKNTNDSTYIPSALSFLSPDDSWQSLPVGLRARGNFRRDNCYYPPIRIKLEKEAVKKTYFEGHKRLKLVLPCQLIKSSNDDIVKEFMAYKIYEIISPYHFNTRLVQIDFVEDKGNKTRDHVLKGFLIEDDKVLAKRFNGKIIERSVHPLQQDAICSVQNDIFQYMIGNTDFSTAFHHNEMLLFIDNKAIPVPYDFDMSGLVDASYAIVSQSENQSLDITSVKQRLYRGFKRDAQSLQRVREEYLNNKDAILQIVDGLALHFEDPREHAKCRQYILEFFEVLANEPSFKKEIVDKARIK